DFEPEEGLATIRLTLTPMVSWMWAAAGLIVLGGAVSAWPRRRDRDARTRSRVSVGVEGSEPRTGPQPSTSTAGADGPGAGAGRAEAAERGEPAGRVPR